MRFLADMGVSHRVVEWLRGRGDDAVHLGEQGLHRLPNGEIFTKAIAEGRIVLTFDLDFAEIVAMTKGRTASVIVFRLRNTRTDNVIVRLGAVLTESTDALARGAVIVVEDSRHRVRRLPVGSAGERANFSRTRGAIRARSDASASGVRHSCGAGGCTWPDWGVRKTSRTRGVAAGAFAGGDRHLAFAALRHAPALTGLPALCSRARSIPPRRPRHAWGRSVGVDTQLAGFRRTRETASEPVFTVESRTTVTVPLRQ